MKNITRAGVTVGLLSYLLQQVVFFLLFGGGMVGDTYTLFALIGGSLGGSLYTRQNRKREERERKKAEEKEAQEES
jgi:membrane associated rhomboid family serine protease